VDQYHGRDKEVILYTCTRSNMGDKGQNGGPRARHILLGTRRLNVAITRTNVWLVIVGDRQTLLRDPFRKMVTFFKLEDVVKHSRTDMSIMSSWDHLRKSLESLPTQKEVFKKL